jgi:hypothetical protein
MRLNQSSPPIQAATARDESISEQTPLLAGQSQPPAEEEPSTKRLLLVLCGIWVGVFLAALGVASLAYRAC